MKTLNTFIIEKLKITKNTKIAKPLSNEYVIFVPYGENYWFMNKHYERYQYQIKLRTGDWKCYLIKIDEAYNVFKSLPNNSLSNQHRGDRNDLTIFKIPDNITSNEELIQIIKDSKCDKINIMSDDSWEQIVNINELKKG